MSVEFLDAQKGDHISSERLVSVLTDVEIDHFDSNDQAILSQMLTDIKEGQFELTNHEDFYLSKAEVKMWPDYLVFRYKFRKLATEKIETNFPLYLLIEPASICNLRCVMCFQTDTSFSGNREYMGRMDLNLFKRLIDEAQAGGTRAITLASRGDPTMHKQLPEMLQYMKGKFLEVKMNTNGILLTDHLSRAILNSEVTDLVFSIDSYEKENYEEIRKKASFDKVLANIQRFMSIRENEFPAHRTTVRVSGVKVDEKQDREAFSQFWGELVDHVVLVDLQERWDTYANDYIEADLLLPCGDLWERMYVWFDGTVNPCDVDYKSTLAVGNVNISSIENVWNGVAYRELRQKHLDGDRQKCGVCRQCSAWTKSG